MGGRSWWRGAGVGRGIGRGMSGLGESQHFWIGCDPESLRWLYCVLRFDFLACRS